MNSFLFILLRKKWCKNIKKIVNEQQKMRLFLENMIKIRSLQSTYCKGMKL